MSTLNCNEQSGSGPDKNSMIPEVFAVLCQCSVYSLRGLWAFMFAAGVSCRSSGSRSGSLESCFCEYSHSLGFSHMWVDPYECGRFLCPGLEEFLRGAQVCFGVSLRLI